MLFERRAYTLRPDSEGGLLGTATPSGTNQLHFARSLNETSGFSRWPPVTASASCTSTAGIAMTTPNSA